MAVSCPNATTIIKVHRNDFMFATLESRAARGKAGSRVFAPENHFRFVKRRRVRY
jgi:hypothetical protein